MKQATGIYAIIDGVVDQLGASKGGKLRSQLQSEVEEACMSLLNGIPEELLDFVFKGFGRAINESLHRRAEDGLRLFEAWRSSRRDDWFWGYYPNFELPMAEANLDGYQERWQGAGDQYEEHRLGVDALRRGGEGTTIEDVRVELVRKINQRRDAFSLSA